MTITTESLIDYLEIIASGSRKAILIQSDFLKGTFTIDTSTNTLDINSHGLVDDTRVRVSVNSGSLPSPLESGKDYFVVNATANDFQVSESKGGTVIDILTTGSGTFTVAEQELDESDSVEVWLNHEVSDYQGSSAKTFSYPTQTTTQGNPATITFTPNLGNINYRWLAILRDADTILDQFFDYGTDQLIEKDRGVTFTLNPRINNG